MFRGDIDVTLPSLKCFLEKTVLIHENRFCLSVSSELGISHLESCMLSAALKDLCLSEEVPFILSGVCEPLNTKLIFSPQLLLTLCQLDPKIAALEIRL